MCLNRQAKLFKTIPISIIRLKAYTCALFETYQSNSTDWKSCRPPLPQTLTIFLPLLFKFYIVSLFRWCARHRFLSAGSPRSGSGPVPERATHWSGPVHSINNPAAVRHLWHDGRAISKWGRRRGHFTSYAVLMGSGYLFWPIKPAPAMLRMMVDFLGQYVLFRFHIFK